MKNRINNKLNTMLKVLAEKQYNLPAFTLMNVMIGIVISALVMTAFYNAFEFIHEEIGMYDNQQKGIIDMLNLQVNLNKEFMSSKKVIQPDENTIQLEYNEGSTLFKFEPAYVLRVKQDNTDTFRIGVVDLKIETNQLLLVKSVSFISVMDKQEIALFFKKEYTAQQLMDLEKEEQ